MTGRAPSLSLWDHAAIALAALQAAAGLYVLRHGPDTPIPMHFDIEGNVDRWGDKAQAGVVILVCAVLTLTTHLILNLASAQAKLDRGSQQVMSLGRIVGLLTPAIVTVPLTYLGAGLTRDAPPQAGLTIALMLAWVLIIVTGVAVGKTRPNPWAGVRVSWTYKSRLAWDKSNRLLGRIYFIGGVAGLLLTPFVDFGVWIALLFATVFGGAALGHFEAWRVWRDDPEKLP